MCYISLIDFSRFVDAERSMRESKDKKTWENFGTQACEEVEDGFQAF